MRVHQPLSKDRYPSPPLAKCQLVLQVHIMDDPQNPYAPAHSNLKGPADARPTALQIIQDNDRVNGLSDLVMLITGCSKCSRY